MTGERWAEERNRLYAAFESTSDAIALFDLDGRLLQANLAFRKFFGLVPEGLSAQDPGHTLEFLKSRAKDPVEFERSFRRLLLHPEVTEYDTAELALPYPRVLLRACAPVNDGTGRVVGTLHTLRDVTKEQELTRMKSEFISTVSHEVRTPLAAIKGSLQLLIESVQNLHPSEQELLAICLRNTERLTSLVNDIVDLSKIQAGKLTLTFADQTVPHLIELALDAVRAQADERQTTFEVTVPQDLPPIRVNRDRIVQVLINLLSNAIKFSGPGERVEISARLKRIGPDEGGFRPVRGGPGDAIEVSVTDRGRGIAPHDLDKLFFFQQLEGSSTRQTRGMGLGLAICKGIVEAHGGRIWASSEGLGHGTTVAFLLPQQGPPRRRILAADDDPTVVEFLVATLGTPECSVVAASNGEEALAKIQEAVPDLLILDLLLPGLDGWEILKILRAGASTRDLPILVLTALGISDAERTIALGADEYLSKPISPFVLRETVSRLVKEAERRRRVAEEEKAVSAALFLPTPEVKPHRKRVLLAEDNPASAELVVELLSHKGFEVETCSDGKEVMHLAKAHRPDLILLDINLPNIDGLSLARMLRNDPQTHAIAIIAVTAYAMAGDRERVLQAGCNAFISKPIDTETFLEVISALIGREQDGAPGEAGSLQADP